MAVPRVWCANQSDIFGVVRHKHAQQALWPAAVLLLLQQRTPQLQPGAQLALQQRGRLMQLASAVGFVICSAALQQLQLSAPQQQQELAPPLSRQHSL